MSPWRPRRCGFSILKRIETVGTRRWAMARRATPFQYPQADRDGRNPAPSGRVPASWGFSILKRIETVGTTHSTVHLGLIAGFSILKRIETVGTRRAADGQLHDRSFSILKRIETVGTYLTVTGALRDAVSVSSSGSRRSERHRRSHVLARVLVSVSSSGSRRSERSGRWGYWMRGVCFSILKRIETVGTWLENQHRRQSADVSVSSSGSRRSELHTPGRAVAHSVPVSVSSSGSRRSEPSAGRIF